MVSHLRSSINTPHFSGGPGGQRAEKERAVAGKLGGKVAIVTGAGRGGLGWETALTLARHGARIGIAEIDPVRAEQAAEDIRAAGGEAIGVVVDIAQEDQVAAMAARVVEAFGGIDILHNNAAILTPEHRACDRDVCNVDHATWLRTMTVNAGGALLCSKHVIPHMIARGGGSLIHSSSGFGGQGDLTLTAYGMSKAAITLMSKSIAAQYGKQGIRSNTIQIGLVLGENAQHSVQGELRQIILDAHLTPVLGVPRNIADVVAFLASDESAFITGATIPVDGGFSSHVPTVAPIRDYFARIGRNAF
jgi:NAD(P)-dependent dehydrogenase (short-subunit alcohol dehydrogenase family)